MVQMYLFDAPQARAKLKQNETYAVEGNVSEFIKFIPYGAATTIQEYFKTLWTNQRG